MLSKPSDHPRKEVNEAMGRVVAVALVAIITLMGVAVVGTPAEAISCVGAGDVTALGPAGCTQGGLTFSDLNLVVGPNSNLAQSFDPDSQIFIRKDIQFGNNSFISEFTQSHDLTPVPEPATLVLLGSTLTGLGVFSRRKLRNKQAEAD